eukprot:jgi/Undpi1/2618/HiC_scaffold_13.g05997.m1
MEPKTPRSETYRDSSSGNDASSVAAAAVATLDMSQLGQPSGGISSRDVNLRFQTPVRRTAVEASVAADVAADCGSSSNNNSSSSSSSRTSSNNGSGNSNSSRKGTIGESSKRVCAGNGNGEAFQTPSLKEKAASCAICLSPLVKLCGENREVYTVQLCRHTFHRGCLTENRRAGNTGCPYCRGALEKGLTPEATAAEREASAAAARQQDQRQAIRNAAGRARMALARSLRRREEALAHEAAAAASAASEGRSDAPVLAVT